MPWKIHKRGLEPPTVFIFQESRSSDSIDVEYKEGEGNFLKFAWQASFTLQFDSDLHLNKAELPVRHRPSEDGQGCSRAGGTLVASKFYWQKKINPPSLFFEGISPIMQARTMDLSKRPGSRPMAPTKAHRNHSPKRRARR